MLLDKKNRVAFFVTFLLLFAGTFAVAAVPMLALPSTPIGPPPQIQRQLSVSDKVVEAAYMDELLSNSVVMQLRAARYLQTSA